MKEGRREKRDGKKKKKKRGDGEENLYCTSKGK